MVEDVTADQCWAALQTDADARLVDVRTDAEWAFVGLPDLEQVGKRIVLIPWQVYPSMQQNAGFVDDLHRAGLAPDHRVYFLCRSGARSRSAAIAARNAGFTHVFNIADGFEGPPNEEGHRGAVAGWKFSGLPWQQR